MPEALPRPLRIGLTGGIGSGKSTVAAMLAELGAGVIDTDRIARELTLAGGAAIEPLRQAFGSEFIDPSGALDRSKMRSIAFKDPTAKQRLEDILHPLIGAQTLARASGCLARVKVFDVPLLSESTRWRALVDRVWVVDCTAATQISRVVQRSGWQEHEVQAVMDRQSKRSQRRAVADAVIHNDSIDLPTLRARVTRPVAASRRLNGVDAVRVPDDPCGTISSGELSPPAMTLEECRLGSLRISIQREHPHDAQGRASFRSPGATDAARGTIGPSFCTRHTVRDHGRGVACRPEVGRAEGA